MSDWSLKLLELTTRTAEAAAREREARHRENEARIKAGLAPLPEPVNLALAQALATNATLADQAPAKQQQRESGFDLEGDTCLLRIRGHERRYRASLGFKYLHYLMHHMGRSFAPMELEAAVKKTELQVPEPRGDQVVDNRALREAKQRIIALAKEREDAEGRGDLGWIERIDDETAQIENHLSAVTGLGGRPRRFTGSEERARKRVCQAIASTVDQLAIDFPEFAAIVRRLLTLGSRICLERPKTL